MLIIAIPESLVFGLVIDSGPTTIAMSNNSADTADNTVAQPSNALDLDSRTFTELPPRSSPR
ncbi:hypothetical protein SAMN04488490_0934 [Marinobacter sp. LV10R510-11A]|uniref:hypothetical protein n=1 Tax=Marinobacter sp. LV10R510-11A TaxID=1415568 RepID=UPI000BB69DA9|nr:hypothetical protein [Marinobacter sp. LV10R510-11A]SOB75352.1 hypothetical protein SAMN04488490_0934 [Marinobacter sp. LV10R510-11A]